MSNLKSIGNIIINLDNVKYMEVVEQLPNGPTLAKVYYLNGDREFFIIDDNKNISKKTKDFINSFVV